MQSAELYFIRLYCAREVFLRGVEVLFAYNVSISLSDRVRLSALMFPARSVCVCTCKSKK